MTESPNTSSIVAAGAQTETFEFIVATKSGRFFWWLTGRPWLVLLAGMLLLVGTAVFLPKLHKDTSAEAFISSEHPAVVYKDAVEEIFGLSDPVIVALVNDGPDGIYNPRSLNLLSLITRELRSIEGVDPERVTSLVTENYIAGDEMGLVIEPFFEGQITEQAEADAIRDKIAEIPLFQGSLVARDGSATMIVAELVDPEKGNAVFHEVMRISEAIPSEENRIYVAGEGAVAEHLGEYVDGDARRVYPIIALVIIGILVVAYRTIRGASLPMFVVLGALLIALGSMAALDVPYYIITSALPVILISIGVADGIHILAEYYEQHAIRPKASSRELVTRSMSEMWHPVFFTSITDATGFCALSLASFMPPLRAFGIFAAVGVVTSMLFSLFVLPAILTLLRPKGSAGFKAQDAGAGRRDIYARGMSRLGEAVIRHPRWVLIVTLALLVAGIGGAIRLQVDYQRIDYFHEDEEIHRADTIINDRFDGTNFMDVVFETGEPEGLFNAEYLHQMEDLQEYMETLPHVEGTISVVDYLKQLNRAINENAPEAYVLPEDENLIAQYFLLYSTSADPTDFQEEIDYEYRMANVRVAMNSGRYSDIATVVEETQTYIDKMFTDPGLKVTLAGRSTVTYHWMRDLASGHFWGVGLALAAVWLCSALSFRSMMAGLYAIVPVTLSILFVYAAMGYFGIWLGVGTSMFAAIGIGISVNFAIHALDRTLELVRDYHDSVEHALRWLFPSTGRALFFNFAAVFFGFGVLMTSQVPPLNAFGILVAVSVAISFIASITLLPAMLLVFRPRFLRAKEDATGKLEGAKITMDEW